MWIPKISASMLLLALAPCAPLYAAAATEDSAPKAAVSYADLNLASANGMATLERRIRVAVGRLCGNDEPRDLRGRAAMLDCRKAAMATTRSQVAALTRATPQLAQAAPVAATR